MVDVAGTLRDGRFVLLQPIGEGAQGCTFDGVDKREGRPVAIKRFDVRGASSWKDVELAEREARVLQSLTHPKLPRYIEHFEQDGALYLVMEKIEGESLAAMKRRGAVLGEEDIWRLLHDASDVLDFLHRRPSPVIHRDLKPGNVIRRPDGSFAFVDFGAVRDKLRPRGGSTVVGTFGYMAPEQVQGRALPASDVYGIGATSIAMITGSEPEELPHRGLAIDVRAVLARKASARLTLALERMLDPDPDRRASRIAPLLAAKGGSSRTCSAGTATGWPPSERAGDSAERQWMRYAQRAERRAHHAARRAERTARRDARRRRLRRPDLPWPARVVLTLVFTIGILAVSLALHVIVPIILGMLSLFFARRSLRNAAGAVRRAGDTAVGGIRASRSWALGLDARGNDVEPPDSPRVRVDGGSSVHSAELDDADDVVAGEEDERRTHRAG